MSAASSKPRHQLASIAGRGLGACRKLASSVADTSGGSGGGEAQADSKAARHVASKSGICRSRDGEKDMVSLRWLTVSTILR